MSLFTIPFQAVQSPWFVPLIQFRFRSTSWFLLCRCLVILRNRSLSRKLKACLKIVSLASQSACSTDDDCELELMCNVVDRRCSCPEPYFLREETSSCVGCAPGWFALHRQKCLLFAISSSPAATWREAEQGCHMLLAQSMCISNDGQFLALQHQIEFLLNGPNALAATVYFQRGAWIEIDHSMSRAQWCEWFPLGVVNSLHRHR